MYDLPEDKALLLRANPNNAVVQATSKTGKSIPASTLNLFHTNTLYVLGNKKTTHNKLQEITLSHKEYFQIFIQLQTEL